MPFSSPLSKINEVNMKIPILSGALLIVILALSPHQSAFGYSVVLQGEAFAAGSATNPLDNTFFTGDLQQPSVNGSVSASVPDANASVNLTAALGSLSGIVGASAVVPVDTSQFAPGSEAIGFLRWQDEVTVTSSTLANGTPVNLLLTEVLDATMTSAGNAGSTVAHTIVTNAFQLNGNGAIGTLQTVFNNGEVFSSNPGTACSGLCSASESVILSAVVGQTFEVVADMSLQAFAFEQSSTGPLVHANAFAQLDAGHTGKLFLDPLTEGASYTTASGATYFAPVPEPSTILLLGFVLIGLAAWRWKHAA
jgi:hypothetical protein